MKVRHGGSFQYTDHLEITLSRYEAIYNKIRSKEPIDLTNYNIALITAKLDSYNCPNQYMGNVIFGFSKSDSYKDTDDTLNGCDAHMEKHGGNGLPFVLPTDGSYRYFAIDISELTGSYYLYFLAANNISRYSYTNTVKIGVYNLRLMQ